MPVFPPPHIDGIVSIVVSPILWIALSLRQICVLFKMNINFPVESTVLIASVVLMAFGRNLWIHCNLDFRLLCREFMNVVKPAPFVLFLFGRNFRLCHFFWNFSFSSFKTVQKPFLATPVALPEYQSPGDPLVVPDCCIFDAYVLVCLSSSSFCNLPFMDIFVILYLNLLNVRECEWGPIFKIFFF